MYLSPDHILHETFGLESFREGQREIIDAAIVGKNVLVLMPTGGGKSLTYQIPSLCREGIALIISPLISLMKDQADRLNSLGIRAEIINSTRSAQEIADILEDLRWSNPQSTRLTPSPSPLEERGDIFPFGDEGVVEDRGSFGDEGVASASGGWRGSPIRFVYIAPERLRSWAFIESFSNLKVSLLAIDEAHCISQWWHDFRTSYLQIRKFVKTLQLEEKWVPIMALTATATAKVRSDIVERLGLKKYETFIKGFDRPNIAIIVREISKKDAKLAKMREIIDKTPGIGIIYCSTINHVDEVYDYLSRHGIASGKYTGSATADERESVQNAFMDDELKVIVATNAFGMGIDKKDIRFVIHYNLPGSIESYYQEAGRAGRDGKNSYSIVLASYQDTKIQEFFIENANPSEKNILAFYDYLYGDMKVGEGAGTMILKTQAVMAKESSIGSDMEVGSIIRILEKYGILERGTQGTHEEGFRGRGLTLTAVRRPHANIGVDWKRQKLLEDEAYAKLEAVKKLLFSPHCRKKHILEYFGDEIDAAKMQNGCGCCDFCLGTSGSGQSTESVSVPLSSFELVLESVNDHDDTYGVSTFREYLAGANTANIRKYGLTEDDNYGILKQYPQDAVGEMISNLIVKWYLEKTLGMYPKLRITAKGKNALRDEDILKTDEDFLTRLSIEIASPKTTKKSIRSKGWKYSETLAFFEEGLDLKAIAERQNLTPQTIQNHLVLLYEQGQISLASLARMAYLDRIERFRVFREARFPGDVTMLKPIKEAFEAADGDEISYFEVKLGLATIENRDR